MAALLVPLALTSPAIAVVFDFAITGGNSSNNSQNGGSGNVHTADATVAAVTATIDNITLTCTAVSSSGAATIGANSQGFGVSTNGEISAFDTRIEGDKGESLRISFGHAVQLDSLRLGNFTAGETAVLSLISGPNPFTAGSSLAIHADGNQAPDTDIVLAGNPIVTGGIGAIHAGTVLGLTITGGSQDALLNELTVSATDIPPGDLVTTTLASFPAPTLIANPTPGPSPGFSAVAAGNAKGQSFSLSGPATITAFVFEIAAVTSPGTFMLDVTRAMDHLPWLAPAFGGTGSLPVDFPSGGGIIRIELPAPLALARGTWTVSLTGITAAFDLRLSSSPLFPSGALVRNNSATAGRWAASSNVDSDAVFAVLGTREAPPSPPTGKPNIIFLLADDLGWTDIRTGPVGPNVIGSHNFGSDYYQTPNLARLAAEGLSFTHCYVQPNCAPTRAALLSGQYSPRSGNGVYAVGDLNRGNGTTALVGPAQNEDVPASHITHAEALAAAGYVTAHFGKFHVGGHEGGSTTLPLNQGFEMNFGGGSAGHPSSYYASDGTFAGGAGPELDLWAANYSQPYLDFVLKGPASAPLHQRADHPNNPDLIISDPTSNHGSNKHLTDGMGDAALAFISDHQRGALKDHPFFMQFHFYAVHTPIHPRWDLRRKYDGLPAGTRHSAADYAALVESLDQTVGRILDHLDDPDGDGDPSDSIAANTLIMFTSDNGGHIGDTHNQPLRYRKGSFWEGGLRVPLIVRQPGTVPAGQSTNTLVHAVDFYPTMLEHAGVEMPAGITFDGTSFANHLLDPIAHPRDRETIFYHFPGYLDNRARPCGVVIKRIRGTDFKLIYNHDSAYVGNNPDPEGLKVLAQPWELYDLTNDMSETTNLITGSYSDHLIYGQIADGMATELHSWLTQPGPDWIAKQPTYRSSGTTVPHPPPDVPDVTVPFSQQFRITAASPASSSVTLTWNSETGFMYDVFASENLSDWSLLEASIPAAGTTTTRTVADPDGSGTRRFYQIGVRRPSNS